MKHLVVMDSLGPSVGFGRLEIHRSYFALPQVPMLNRRDLMETGPEWFFEASRFMVVNSTSDGSLIW